eukprot:TRINITY_DN2916_c0_g1_i1.p1 TRINITY_DN2916_c0_g1~~TRINITY_DN2916_c0_g1_i1.p1  ORF type:complete len:360 (+),score=117.49 TRINITY_DN2916_c0_g1_i1:33-1082(+)
MSKSVKRHEVEYAEESEDETQYEEQLEEDDVQPIEALTTLGISATDVKKLTSAGFHTVRSIIMHTRKDLANVKGISDAKVEKIIEAATKLENSVFVTGTQALEKRQQIIKITTGCTEFDNLLKGGLETRALTEIFGEFRTGKTQLVHTLAVTCQLPREMGGGEGKVAIIDTEGTFRPEKLTKIAERYGLDADAVRENIVYARAYTHEHQMQLLQTLGEQMVSDRFRLIIIDSVTGLFRVDFSGRGELAERQQRLAQMLSRLIKTAEEFNVAVLMTNQVMSDPGASAMFVSDPKKPIGGHILAHASTVRIYLKKGRGETRVAKIYDAPDLPEGEATFVITDAGIADVESL